MDINFVYQAPDPHCAPVSTIDSLSHGQYGEYALDDDPYFDENEEWIKAFCNYHHTGIPDDELGMLLDDHLIVTAHLTHYHERSDSPWSNSYRDLPVWSDDLEDWAAVGIGETPRVWREGCGSGSPCADYEQPTVTTYKETLLFMGFVGNLEFYARISYIAQEMPDDAWLRAAEVFRDLVRAEVDRREKVE